VVRYCEIRVQRTKREAATQVIEGITPEQSMTVQPEKVC
jgi:hypothetical protein